MEMYTHFYKDKHQNRFILHNYITQISRINPSNRLIIFQKKQASWNHWTQTGHLSNAFGFMNIHMFSHKVSASASELGKRIKIKVHVSALLFSCLYLRKARFFAVWKKKEINFDFPSFDKSMKESAVHPYHILKCFIIIYFQ